MQTKRFSAVLGALLIAVFVQDGLAYSKYGRSCSDIGCQRNEVCKIVNDCTGHSEKCGSYPTCQKIEAHGCSSIVCGQNTYCKTVNGEPKCVEKDSTNGFESAGVSYVHGQRNNDRDNTHSSGRPNFDNHNNANPYANANAPVAPPEPSGSTNYHRLDTGTNLGYPPYPNSAGSHNNNNGYPPYPSGNQGNQQYNPLYPSLSGQQGYSAQGYPAQGYPAQGNHANLQPGQQYPGAQKYPSSQHHGYQNHPYQNYPQQNQRGFGYNTPSVHYGPPNGATSVSITIKLISFITALVLFTQKL